MKIISRFKDYYDFVQHQYGGGDSKIVYERDFVIPDGEQSGYKYERTVRVDSHLVPGQPDDFYTSVGGKRVKHEFRILVVMNRYYWLERMFEATALDSCAALIHDWHVTSRPILETRWRSSIFPMLTPEERKSLPDARRDRMREQQEEEWEKWHLPQGQARPYLVELCKHMKAPIMLVDGDSHRVYGRTPKLGELGFVQYYSPEQLYQELAMFISNELKPFVDPPSPMSNIEKVVSHGFDKKASFRHRK